jgi:hypothetical protein
MDEILKNNKELWTRILNDYEDYIYSPDTLYIMNDKLVSVFSDAFHQFVNYFNEQEVSFEAIEIGLNILMALVVEVIVDKHFEKFIEGYTILARNYNQEILKSDIVKEKIEYLTRVISKNLTLSESIRISQEILKKNKEMCKWKPPSFTLSEHYITLLRG